MDKQLETVIDVLLPLIENVHPYQFPLGSLETMLHEAGVLMRIENMATFKTVSNGRYEQYNKWLYFEVFNDNKKVQYIVNPDRSSTVRIAKVKYNKRLDTWTIKETGPWEKKFGILININDKNEMYLHTYRQWFYEYCVSAC